MFFKFIFLIQNKVSNNTKINNLKKCNDRYVILLIIT